MHFSQRLIDRFLLNALKKETVRIVFFKEKIMQNEKLENLYDQIVHLKMSELVELTEMLKDRLSLRIIGGFSTILENVVKVEDKKRYMISVEAISGNKIEVIKAIKEVKGLGLKESKEFVDNIIGKTETFDDLDQANELLNTYEKVGLKVALTEV